jgi:hypothetical protein
MVMYYARAYEQRALAMQQSFQGRGARPPPCPAPAAPAPTRPALLATHAAPSAPTRVTSWPGLNRIDRILISTRYTFFSGSSSEKNSRLSVLGLERFEDG